MTPYLTLKARSMPRFSHSFHPSLPATNRPLAHGTFNAKQFLIILLTIWFPSIDIEALRTDLLATVTADKVFRMERLAHGLNARLRKEVTGKALLNFGFIRV